MEVNYEGILKVVVVVVAFVSNLVWHAHTGDLVGFFLSIGLMLTFGSLMATLEKEIMMIIFKEKIDKLKQDIAESEDRDER